MSKVAIITARGGSKRIPGKNIKSFLGKPIIAYSIEAALESALFNEVMVSTDDYEIANVAEKYGAKVPFLRSVKASDDFATTADALLDVFQAYESSGKYFEYACCVYPTAPFVTSKKMIDAYNKLFQEDLDCVFPIMLFNYPIFRSLIKDNNRLRMIWEQYRNTRSQDLPLAYHDAGQFYFFNVAAFLRNKTLISDKVSGIEISDLEGQDIDNFSDWQLAELKYQLLKINNGK